MQTGTFIMFGFLAAIVLLSSCDAKRLYLDNNDDLELEDQNDDDFDKRDSNCVQCAFKIFDCCPPNICQRRFLRPNKCISVKP